MKIQFDSFIRILRLLGTLCFCAVFLYWSINAINKYIDGPISSTVSYQFGDDGNGNIEFPAISICLDSFKWVVLSGISKNCSTSAANIPRLTDALRYCTAENTQSQATTTTWCGGLFGCIFNEEEEDIYYPFKNVEDLLDASKIIDITDILSGFQFGQTKLLSRKILVDRNTNDEIRKERLREYWKPTLNFERGFCYTFEPKKYTNFPVLYHGEILSIELKFGFKNIFSKFKNAGNSKDCGYKDAYTKTEVYNEQLDENGHSLEICKRCIKGQYECGVQYHILIHNSRETLINDLDTGPFVKIGYGDSIFAEISKSNLDSIATEKNPCINEDEILTRTECLLDKADREVIEKYNCTLPWKNDTRYEICPIIDNNRNETYVEIIKMWEYYYYSLQGLGCPQMPKCKRSIYKLSKEPNANNWYGSSMQDRPSELKIQLESPNVQTIKDQVAYDLQSLIGEVGGTLGLFLGLSTMSFIDFIEFIFRKLFP